MLISVAIVALFIMMAFSEEKSSPWSSTILILKLTSSEGRVGFGEAPTQMMTLPVKESMNEVARIFQNKNYFNIEKNLRDYYKNAFHLPQSRVRVFQITVYFHF